MRKFIFGVILLLAFPALLLADKPKPKDKPAPTGEDVVDFAAIEKSFKFQTGKIPLGTDLASLSLPAGYRFLDGTQAEKVITELWGNPSPRNKPLGLILPPDNDLISEDSWAVIVTYTDEGHVEDGDANSINYDEMLKDMQKASAEENAERTKQGFGAVEIIGWAERPRYEAASHKLYWAKNLKFVEGETNTLNYDVRALGRTGVLSMNAVASMKDLAKVQANMKDVIGFVEFNKGKRYEDFDSSVDKVAAYGLGALIAGTAAAKVGLFKGLLVALLAAKKLVIVGLVALGALLKKLFSGKSEE